MFFSRQKRKTFKENPEGLELSLPLSEEAHDNIQNDADNDTASEGEIKATIAIGPFKISRQIAKV